MKLCFRLDGTWPIELRQAGRDNFTVVYGKQVDAHLMYGQACAKLGQAIMHRLSCDGKVDNGERIPCGRR